jgi:uncharacterized protein YjdB
VSGNSTVTDATGHTQVNWTLGTTPGGKEVTATIQGGQSVSFSANATVGPVASVTISPDPGSVTVGATGTFTAAAKDQYGNTVSSAVSWSSSNQSVATVGATTGIVTGIERGTSILTALISGVTGTTTLTVDPAPPPWQVSSLEVVSTTVSSATIQFLGADDGTGAPAYYELRYDEDFAGWETATPVTTGVCADVFQGGGIGVQITCVVDGLTNGTTYFFYVRGRRTDPDGTVVVGVVANASGTTTSVDPAVPASIAVIDGDGQTGAAGQFLNTPLLVEVLNGLGQPLSDVTVEWAVATGGGSLSAASTTTLASGRTEVEWALGTEAGEGRVTATVAGLSPVEFGATITAGRIATVVVTPDPQTIEVGASATFSAVAKDSHGNVVPSTFTWSSQDPAIAAISDPPGTVIGVSAGGATISATPSIGGVLGSTSVNVEPERFPSITIQGGNNQEGTAGQALPEPLLVLVHDASANPAVGFPVVWTVTQGGGAVSSGSVNTDDQGYAQVTWTVGATAGTNAVTASVSGIGSVKFSATGAASGGGGGEGGVVFSDGFESGDPWNATGGRWYDLVRAQVSSENPRTGDYSLRFFYPGNPDPAVDAWSEIRGEFPANPAPEIWLEWYLYIPTNYVHRDPGGGNNNKFWIVGYDDKLHGGWAEPGGWTTRMEIVPGWSTGDISAGRTVYGNQTLGGSSAWDLAQPWRSGIIREEHAGTWVRYGVHVKTASSESAADGQIDVWVNGVMRVHNPNVALATGSFAHPINCFELMGWANSGFVEDTIFYIDDVKVYTSNPGW